jgi:predicted dehydrogenase
MYYLGSDLEQRIDFYRSVYSDPDPIGAQLAKEHGVPIFTDVDEFLQARQQRTLHAKGAVVCTPTHTHATLGKKLTTAGVATLIEKPLAVTGAEGCELLRAAKGKGLIMVGHHRRHNPFLIAVKKLIDEGKLGKLVAVSGSESSPLLSLTLCSKPC